MPCLRFSYSKPVIHPIPINRVSRSHWRAFIKPRLAHAYLQVCVVFVGQGHVRGGVHFLLVLCENGLVDLNLRRRKGRCSDELERLVADKFSGKPEERLLEVVVGLG